MKLTGAIISKDFIENLQTENLEELNFGYNISNYDAASIKYLSRFKNLQVFKSSYLKIDNDLLQGLLSNLSENLSKLDIAFHDCLLKNEPINNFGKFINLESFSIHYCSLSSKIQSRICILLRDLSQCKYLKHLALKNLNL